MSNHDGHNPRPHSREDVSRGDRRRTSSTSLDYSEHSSIKSGISSLYTEDLQNQLDGKDLGWKTSRCGIPAAFGELFQASYNSGGNELGGSDHAFQGSKGVFPSECGSSGGSTKGSYSRAEALFDSDQALYGSRMFSEKSVTLCGSSNGSYNVAGKTLYDSNQALCGSIHNSGSSNTSLLNSWRGRISHKVRGSALCEKDSDISPVGLSQCGMSNRRVNQVSNMYVQRFDSAKPFCGVGRVTLPYQIEFRIENLGKQISASKRHIHFRFGFANEGALSKGNVGHDCRGVEHHLCITWSITGSKRLITMDGREVSYSAGKRANESRRADILEASWDISDHHYELMCYSYKPSTSPFEKRDSRWKQYNLMIDGKCFFELPHISDLGAQATYSKPSVSNSSDLSVVGGTRSISAASRSSGMKSDSEVKKIIQARIDRQRQELSARLHSASSESRRTRYSDDASLHSEAVSVTPSDLTEFTNQNYESSTRNLNESDYQLALSCNIAGSPSQDHYQMQSLPLQSQPQPNALTKREPSFCQQRRLISTQLSRSSQSDYVGQLQPHHSQISNPPTTQRTTQSPHHITYPPKHPPSYNQITRSILGAYDAGVEGLTARDQLPTVLETGN